VRERRAGKPWWRSRVLWANAAAFLAAAAVLPELPPEAGRYALMLASLINIALRVMTRQPLKAK
jgi:hypothetical protein